MKPRTIIIDCDPGVDDTFALFYAFAQDHLNIPLVCSVSGNVDVEYTTENLRRVVAMQDRKPLVAKGANRPLVSEPFYATYIHGKNGMGGYQFKDDKLAPLSSMSAVKAMFDVISKSSEKITLVAVGPLTNIAQLFMDHPEVKTKIELLSIMGGGLKGGNTNIAAEFNFLVDPEAAKYVFDQEVPIMMAGLDVTEKAFIDETHLRRIAESSDIGKFLSEVILGARGQDALGFRTSLHDVVSVMALDHLEIYEYEDLHVVIETEGVYTRGMSIADQRLRNRIEGNVRVLRDIDHDRFMDLLCESLEYYR